MSERIVGRPSRLSRIIIDLDVIHANFGDDEVTLQHQLEEQPVAQDGYTDNVLIFDRSSTDQLTPKM